MTGDVPVPQSAPPELGFEEFQRIYGPISALSPTEATALFGGAPARLTQAEPAGHGNERVGSMASSGDA
jgi:hypothetical protein